MLRPDSADAAAWRVDARGLELGGIARQDVRLKLMGAHRLSATQQVRSVQPQSLGTGTPHSTLPRDTEGHQRSRRAETHAAAVQHP